MNPPLVFRPYCPSSEDTVYRDTLPHRFRAGRTVFVTWRLSDSLPAKAELESCLRKAQQRWLDRQRLPFCPWSQDVESILLDRYPEKVSDFRLINFRVREQFDCKELGSCVLRHRRAVDAVRAGRIPDLVLVHLYQFVDALKYVFAAKRRERRHP